MNTPVYDPRVRRWEFSQQRNAGFRLFPVGSEERVVGRSAVLDDPGASTRNKTKKWWTRCLAQDAPEMGPAMEWVDNYFEESQLLAVTTKTFDPVTGHLLAFGAGVNREIRGDRVTNVAAFARGPTGADLMLLEMGKEKRHFENSDGVDLVVPHLAGCSAAPHYQFRSPIRQLCFAGNPYQNHPLNPRLAVRTSGSTKIFRVIYKLKQQPGYLSRLSVQPLATVTPVGTGDHADVAFNYLCERQFATVDQGGNWRVWDIEGAYERARKGFGITLKHSAGGRVTAANGQKEDGWARIMWAGDVTTVMACDRHTAALFDIRTNMPSPSIALPIDRDRNWILDLQRGATMGSGYDAFVLTSSHVTRLDIRQPGRALLSWPHRRHRDDISMYLELIHSKRVTTAVVGSRMNFLTTCYQFSTGAARDHVPAMLGDPYILSPPFVHEEPSNSAVSMAYLPCSLQNAKDAAGPASEYKDKDANFFVGFSIDKEMRISQRLYSTLEDTVPLVDRTQVSAEYIVESDEEFAEEPTEDTTSQTAPTELSGSKGCKSHRRANLVDLYNSAFKEGEEALRTAQDGDSVNSIRGYCSTLAGVLGNRAERGHLGISPLVDVWAPSLLFDKLTNLEAGIEELLSSMKIQDSFEVKTLIPKYLAVTLLIPGESPQVSIQDLYENMVATRVTPLPANVPARVRLRRERLARLIATDVYLASVGVSVKPSLEQLVPPESQLASITPPAPLRGLSRLQDGPPLPEITRNNVASEPLQRIRSYAYVQTRVSLLDGIGRVLDGWKVGEDPSEFEFFVDPEEGVPRYRKDRRKIRKEKEKQLSGQFGSGGASEIFGGSQPPLLADRRTGSQPGPSQSYSQSQSQGGFTVSQFEKGRHGGRMQKKRKTGF